MDCEDFKQHRLRVLSFPGGLMRRYIAGNPRLLSVGGACRGRLGGARALRVIAWLGLLLGAAAGASEREGELLAPDQGMNFLRRVAEVHEGTLKRLEPMRLEYRRAVRETRFHNGETYLLESEISGVEIHTPEGAYYEAEYRQRYPKGNPGGFASTWSKRVVRTQSHLASWTAGSDIGYAWEQSEANAAAIAREISMIRASLLVKAFGDGNMTIRELIGFLEAHKEWRVEVRRLEEDGAALYMIAQYAEPGRNKPYRTVTVAEDKGYLVTEIQSYDTGGGLRERTRLDGAETEGLWLPKRYEIVEYGEHGHTSPGVDEATVILNGTFEARSIAIGEEANSGAIGISMIGLDDGYKFVVADTNGAQSMAVLLDDQLLPEEVYEMFEGMNAQQNIALEPEENTTVEGASK